MSKQKVNKEMNKEKEVKETPKVIRTWQDWVRLISGIGIAVLLVASLTLYLVLGLYSVVTKILFIATGVVLIVALVFNWKMLVEFFKRSGSMTGLFKSLQFIIVIAVMVFIYVLADTVSWKMDLTSNRLFSFSEETRQVLKDVTNEMKILLFKPKQKIANPIVEYQENLLRTYAEKNKRIKFEIVDPVQNPVMAYDYNVQEPGITVIEYEGNRRYVNIRELFEMDQNSGNVTYLGEAVYTGTIKSLLYSKAKNVYILTGHGEIDTGDTSVYGFSSIIKKIQEDYIRLTPLDLLKFNSIPDDCGALIIANPTRPIPPDQLDRINRYIDEGGSVLVLLEYKTHFLINDIMKNMGLFFIPNMILDEDRSIPEMGPAVIVPDILSKADITMPLKKNRISVVLPTAAGIDQLPRNELSEKYEYFIRPLLQTSQYAWAEKSAEQIASGKVKQDKTDIEGPLNPAFSVERLKNDIYTNESTQEVVTNKIESRMVVIGDTDFVNNMNFSLYGNVDLLLNSLNYLLKREKNVTVRPKTSEIRDFVLSSAGKRVLTFVSFILFAIYLGIGILISYRRRKSVKEEVKPEEEKKQEA